MRQKNSKRKRKGNYHAVNKTPAEIQELIKARMNEPGLSRVKLAEELGVCMSTLYRYIRMFGGEIDHAKSIKQDGIEDMIRRYYPHYSSREIEAMQPEGYKLSKGNILKWAKLLGVEHTPETQKRIKEKVRKNIYASHTEEGIKRRAEKRRRTMRMEYLRIHSGMPQQTKLRLKRMPDRYNKAAWRLETIFRYIATTDPYLFWYDEETSRTRCEKLYIKRYGFRFEQLPEGE